MKKNKKQENCTNYEKFQGAAYNPRKTNTLDNNAIIKGYDFGKKFDFDKFIESYTTTGFQATEFGKAVEITKQMIKEETKIFLSFTGNAISSGLREIITYLVKNKFVDVIITTGSGIEEDIIKFLSDFRLGNFDVSGRSLFEHGVGRIGNIFVPSDRYLYFEKFMNPIFEEILQEQETLGRPLVPFEITKLLGAKLDKNSYLYWACKNNIPVYCPGIMDGSLGDLVYFFKKKKPKFLIDVTEEYRHLVDYVLQQEKTGALVLGGGISKHYNLNSQIFREGFDYAVYLTTAHEFDGSDSGGNQEEAKSWAKIKLNAPCVKVKADFTLTFPLLIASTFAKK